MTIAPYIALFSLVAVGVAEAVVYTVLKDDAPSSQRVQPE